MDAILVEHNKGELAEPGNYVSGNDGNLYEVLKWDGSIYINNGSRYVKAVVELADWEDVDDEWERGCIAKIEVK